MKLASRLVFLVGAVAIGLFLFRAAPRDVTLVYGLGDARPRALEVDIDRGGKTVRRAEFRFAHGAPPTITQRMRLTDGDYLLRVIVETTAGDRRVVRPITVTESGTIVLPIDAR